MRIDDEAPKSVVFLGFPSSDPSKGGIDCFGTGFLIHYDDVPHLVTVRHVAEFIGDSPFLVRLNTISGAENIHLDQIEWHFNADPNIDVAIIPFDVPMKQGYDCYFVANDELMWFRPRLIDNIGVGDFCYTIGLFRLLAGKARNQPVVHFGTVARMNRRADEDEPIPVRDWRDPTGKKTVHVEAFLVESQSLSGLSGAPVFVRPTLFRYAGEEPPDPRGFLASARRRIFLLGMWQGAWDAPPDEALSVESGKDVRVPVGMGVVVPVDQIIYTLDEERIKAVRKRIKDEAQASSAASLDVAGIKRPSEAPAATGGNPQHREDFTSLLGAAARKQQ